MHLAFTLALIALLLAPPAHAQTTAPAVEDQQKQAAPKRGFLWEARKGERRVILLGTIHVGRADFFPPHAEVLKRLQEAEVIAVEVNAFDAKRTVEVMQRLALYADGTPGLETRLSDDLRKRIGGLLARSNLDPARMWRMKPWMLANTLVILEAARLGFSPAYAQEAFLFGFAGTSGKPLVEIESIELQLGLFERVSTDVQIAYLEQAVRGIESGAAEREVRRVVSAWENRDLAAADKVLAEMRSSSGTGERFVVDQLFDARHPGMLDAIDRYAASGKLHAVAVGSLHFFGPSGLIEGLRSRGYTVTFVP